MASLINRNGNWSAQFYDAERSPKRKRVSLRTKDKSTARALLSKFERLLLLGEADPWTDDMHEAVRPKAPESERLTIAEAKEQFLQSRRDANAAERTVKNYADNLRRMLEGVDTSQPLSKLTAGCVRRYVHAEGIAAGTRKSRYRHVRAFLRYHDRASVLEGVRNPKAESKLPVACTPEELFRICEAVKDDYRRLRPIRQAAPGQMLWRINAFWFAFLTGLRRSEIARVRWRDVDLEAKHLRIRRQKSRKEQRQPLSEKATRLLRRMGEGEQREFVFHGPGAARFERSAEGFASRLSHQFTKYRKAAGVRSEVTFHSLRAGYVTQLAKAGLNAVAIKRLARHADINTSLRYIEATGESFRGELDAAFG